MTNCSKLLALRDLSTPNRSSILVAAAVGVGAAAAYGAYRYPRCGSALLLKIRVRRAPTLAQGR